MATDTLSTPTVVVSGAKLTFTTSGTLAGDITVDPSKITLTGTSEIDGTTSTASRTNNIVSATVSGSTLTCILRDPWHDDDTSITIALAEGAFTDASANENAALGSTAVTNNSTVDYAVPFCRVVIDPFRKYTGEFSVWVIAAAGCYDGFESDFGIKKVAITVTEDAATPGDAITKDATAISVVDTPAEFADTAGYSKMIVFEATFDASDGGDWGAGGADQGLASIVAVAHPRIGDAGALGSSGAADENNPMFVFLDPDDDYDVRHAVVDPTSGDDTGSARIGTGDGGYWAGTDSVDATAEANPFQTMMYAVSACQRGDGTTAAPSHGTASMSVLYLVEDSHTLGTYAFARRIDTTLGPVIITRLPGTTKANVKLTGSGASGINTNAIVLDDIRMELGASGQVATGSNASYTGTLLSNQPILVRRRVDWVGEGRLSSMSSNPIQSGFDSDIVVGGSQTALLNNNLGTISMWHDLSDTANDVHNTNSLGFLNSYTNLDSTGAGTHLDLFQVNTATTIENIGIWQPYINGLTKVQAPFFCNATDTSVVRRFCLFGVIAEDDGASTAGQCDGNFTDFFWYQISSFDKFSFRETAISLSLTNYWIVNSAFAAFGVDGVPDYDGLWCKRLNVNEAVADIDWADGGYGYDGYYAASSFSTDFVDTTSTWRPVAGGNATGRWTSANQSVGYDVTGTAAEGFIGALAAEEDPLDTVYVKSGESGEGTSPSDYIGSLSAAIVAAAAGATINVHGDSVFRETVDVTKQVTIQAESGTGRYTITGRRLIAADAWAIHVDAGGTGRIIYTEPTDAPVGFIYDYREADVTDSDGTTQRLWIGHLPESAAANLTAFIAEIAAGDVPSWYHNGTNLYVYFPGNDDPRSSGKTTEWLADPAGTGFRVSADDTLVSGFRTDCFLSPTVGDTYWGFQLNGVEGCTIEDFVVSDCFYHSAGATGGKCIDNVFRNFEVLTVARGTDSHLVQYSNSGALSGGSFTNGTLHLSDLRDYDGDPLNRYGSSSAIKGLAGHAGASGSIGAGGLVYDGITIVDYTDCHSSGGTQAFVFADGNVAAPDRDTTSEFAVVMRDCGGFASIGGQVQIGGALCFQRTRLELDGTTSGGISDANINVAAGGFFRMEASTIDGDIDDDTNHVVIRAIGQTTLSNASVRAGAGCDGIFNGNASSDLKITHSVLDPTVAMYLAKNATFPAPTLANNVYGVNFPSTQFAANGAWNTQTEVEALDTGGRFDVDMTAEWADTGTLRPSPSGTIWTTRDMTANAERPAGINAKAYSGTAGAWQRPLGSHTSSAGSRGRSNLLRSSQKSITLP